MSAREQNLNDVAKAAYHTPTWPPKVKVIGIGNVLMGDDGFGPLAVEMFRCRYECGQGIEIIDLGTPGLDMAPYLYGSDLVILVDCVQADQEPGSVHIYREWDIMVSGPQFHMTGHDPGLQETLVQLRMAGRGPSELLILGVVPEHCDVGRQMSAAVRGAADFATETIACLLEDHGIDCSSRQPAAALDVWWFDDFAGFNPVTANVQSGRKKTASELQHAQ